MSERTSNVVMAIIGFLLFMTVMSIAIYMGIYIKDNMGIYIEESVAERQHNTLNELKLGNLILMCKHEGSIYKKMRNIPVSLSLGGRFVFKDGSFIYSDNCEIKKAKKNKINGVRK